MLWAYALGLSTASVAMLAWQVYSELTFAIDDAALLKVWSLLKSSVLP